MFEKRPSWAKGQIFDGRRYGIQCTWEGEGEVFGYDENRVILKFRNEPSVKSTVYGWIWLPKFVISTEETVGGFQFRRIRRLPQQVFEFQDNGKSIGEIVQRNPIYTRYDLNLADGTKWSFTQPLFSIGFYGSSSDGGRILFWLKTHRFWQLVIEPKYDSLILVVSMAFLHRERLRHG